MVNLTAEDLVAGYDDEDVLKEISLTIEEGDFIGVIGPNGCGKSTLIRCLTGVLDHSGGQIKLNRKPLEDLSRKKIARSIAVVPQDTYISFPYSVEDVVLMGRTPYLGRFQSPGERCKELAEKAMEATGITRFKERSVRELSGGEMQRVVVARALTQDPEILMLDEATSHLDIGHKVEVMDVVRKKNRREGLSVLSVHHNLNLAARYCDRMILMDDGEIHAKGTPEEVLTRGHLRAVYGVDAEVHENPRDGSLYVSPVEEVKNHGGGPRIHLVCGGGTGGKMMKQLVEDGFEVTAGVLNVLDSDHEKAKFLDVKSVTEPPFSGIGEEAYKRNLEYIREADQVVGTSFPMGRGNIKNLEALHQAAKMGKEVHLLGSEPIQERDHTGGEAADLYEDISDLDEVQVYTRKAALIENLKGGRLK